MKWDEMNTINPLDTLLVHRFFYHIVNPSQARNPYSNNNQDQHLEKDCKRFIFLVSISTILSPSLLLDSGMYSEEQCWVNVLH